MLPGKPHPDHVQLRDDDRRAEHRQPGLQRYQGGIAFEHIWENSPAEAMGLQIDDILLRFAHNPINSPADFQKWLYMYGVGRKVDLYVLRGGEILVKEYTIEERPQWAVPK